MIFYICKHQNVTKQKININKNYKVQNVKLTYRKGAGNIPTYDLGFTSCIFK